MDIRDLLKRKASLVAEAQALLGKDDATDDEIAKANGLLAEAEKAQARIEALEKAMGLDKQGPPPIDVGYLDDQSPSASVPATPRSASGPFRSFGEQMWAIYHAARPENAGRVDERLFKVQAAASGMGESVPSDGGFLVQPEFSQTILERAYSTGEILQKIDTIPLGAGRNGLKIPGVDETSRADGSRWGGIRAYWEGEAEKITGTKPKFGMLDLQLKKLTALVYVTDELLEDVVALEAFLMKRVPLEINFKVEDAIIRGTGSGQPLGILNAPCLVTVSKESGQAADTIVFENISKMWARMWAPSRKNAVWLINQECEPEFDKMHIPVGTGGIPVYLPPGGLSQSPYATLKGRPVIPVEYCSALGEVGDIILADFSQYQAIDKGVLKTATSIHVRFDYNETAFRFVFRFDGQPTWKSALTPYKGSSTLSPFVALAARA